MKDGLFLLIACCCVTCCDCMNITAGVGYGYNRTLYVVNNSVTWYEAFTGCQSKGMKFLEARSSEVRKYLAFGLEKHGWQSGRFWLGSIKPELQTAMYSAKTCSVMDWDYGLPIEMTNSTQCLFIDLSGTGTIEFTDCLLKYPFVCGKGKVIQEETYDSIDITEISVPARLSIQPVIYNMTEEDCENWCISLFSCVYCTFEENNCTFWTDTTYDADVSYDLSISSRSILNSSTYIKTANRVHWILVEEDIVYNNTFNCDFSFPVQNTTEESTSVFTFLLQNTTEQSTSAFSFLRQSTTEQPTNLTVCEFCPPAEKCNATSMSANITLEIALEIAEDLRKNLTVDKTSLSSYRRRLECADDSRPSSKVFGGFALAVLVSLLVITIVLDCPTLTRHLRLCNVRTKKYKDLERSCDSK
ncbi:uncharacterized protein LOC143056029 isoform X1 [Mytilus galloprovincialis]|uniref:uncharacterized protein LOC143056029 isoform X1 n=1 Tax=Mytilus galloprovincialis TaxID=29158 RepID=UPI003F7B9AF6